MSGKNGGFPPPRERDAFYGVYPGRLRDLDEDWRTPPDAYMMPEAIKHESPIPSKKKADTKAALRMV